MNRHEASRYSDELGRDHYVKVDHNTKGGNIWEACQQFVLTFKRGGGGVLLAYMHRSSPYWRWKMIQFVRGRWVPAFAYWKVHEDNMGAMGRALRQTALISFRPRLKLSSCQVDQSQSTSRANPLQDDSIHGRSEEANFWQLRESSRLTGCVLRILPDAPLSPTWWNFHLGRNTRSGCVHGAYRMTIIKERRVRGKQSKSDVITGEYLKSIRREPRVRELVRLAVWARGKVHPIGSGYPRDRGLVEGWAVRCGLLRCCGGCIDV